MDVDDEHVRAVVTEQGALGEQDGHLRHGGVTGTGPDFNSGLYI